MLYSDVLVLNSSFIPIRVASVKEAICLITSERAFPVIEEDRYIRSPSISIKMPSVISIIGYNRLHKKRVTFSKLNVIYRDDMTCQYCGKRFSVKDLTVDHVIPRSRWKVVTGKPFEKGSTNWHNSVCACKWCNNRKGNKLLNEIGWFLLNKPYEPKYMPYIFISVEKAKRKGWLPFCSFNVRLIEIIP